ncbi:TIGR02444 family protein [uncultured Shewanella sp.]|uniref:TIGR02444 family protein n=1 Tax=uncultured Shewanella sp. TaxID=173975 RepID=UPI00261C73F1|nr:TIGR02444 family protein [uncultured Shewanella sp.]
MTLSSRLSLSLWSDCDTLYMQHQSLCLQLQDDHQLNVNLLLLALWLDKHHYLLPKPQWRQLQQDTRHWEEKLLLPYRQLRRQSKACLEIDEYRQMLDLELMLERKSQAMILNALELMSLEEQASTRHYDNLGYYLGLFNLQSHRFSSLMN